MSITHHGVREVESAMVNPGEATYYFPPVNIINVKTMIGSTIQQASPEALQSVAIGVNRVQDIQKFIDALTEGIEALKLDSTQKADLEAEIATIKAQLETSKPKNSVLSECLLSIRSILEGAAGGALAAVLIQQLAPILGG